MNGDRLGPRSLFYVPIIQVVLLQCTAVFLQLRRILLEGIGELIGNSITTGDGYFLNQHYFIVGGRRNRN